MKKITVILLCSIVFIQLLHAQSPLLDSAKNELYRINKVFDSSRYLGFDLNISYKNDSSGSGIITETDNVSGNYVLNKKNLYYQMGSTQYVQTDSFSYNIYSDEKMMIMTKNMVPENSDVFPLKTFVDSTIQYYGSGYTITMNNSSIDSTDYIKRITFTNNLPPDLNSGAHYISFSIEYNDESYYPSRFQFSYVDITQTEDSIPYIYTSIKTVTMNFSNYKAFVNTDIFNDAQYIIYNRQRKIYETADKYKEYRFITSGFDNEDEDAQYYREVPVVPEGNNN